MRKIPLRIFAQLSDLVDLVPEFKYLGEKPAASP
jgi:hypothetical protein